MIGPPDGATQIADRAMLHALALRIRSHPSSGTARYAIFQYDWAYAGWVPHHIMDATGDWLVSPERTYDVLPGGRYHRALATIEPDLHNPKHQEMTLDLDLIDQIGIDDPFCYTVAEYALNDPQTPAPWVIHWSSFPWNPIRGQALCHPNLPEYIRAIASLGR